MSPSRWRCPSRRRPRSATRDDDLAEISGALTVSISAHAVVPDQPRLHQPPVCGTRAYPEMSKMPWPVDGSVDALVGAVTFSTSHRRVQPGAASIPSRANTTVPSMHTARRGRAIRFASRERMEPNKVRRSNRALPDCSSAPEEKTLVVGEKYRPPV
jgi:hypothetical protein